MWQFIFWACIGLAIYTYFGYPLTLYLLSRLPRRKRHSIVEVDYPSVCLLISAFNEEKVIRTKIENSLGLTYPHEKLTILVASDGSDDETVRITKEFADRGVRVYHSDERSGKSAVINRVVPDIEEDVVVFTDANALFAEDALERLVRRFADPSIGCVVGKLRYVDRHTTAVGKGESIYWRYEGMLSVLESKMKSVLVANGSIFGIRRELFENVSPHVANDFQIPFDIARHGHGIVYEPEAVALERCTIFWHEEFQRKVRIVLRGLTGLSKMTDKVGGMRLWQLVSHKLLRWAMGPVLFVALFANVMLMEGSVFYAVLALGQVAFYLAALNGWRMRGTRRPHAVFNIPFYFTMVNFAAVIAMAKFASGQRQTVWEKAESARFAPAVNGSFRQIRQPIPIPREKVLETDALAEEMAKN
ncbi:MAG: glycosyltransferase family 2 protein [bacterium]|nr:glycosyltransferase family 2 protein [bacterium]